VSDNHRFLVDRDGTPFLIHGESPWDLVTTPTWTEAIEYLDNRRAKGITTLLVLLIERKAWPHVAPHAPNTVGGLAPFLRPGDFATPNDAYFDYAHSILAAVRDRGMEVLLTPAYMGYTGLDEGWWDEMSRADSAACAAYGAYVARRFADLDNIVWVHGGDRIPPAGSSGEACGLAIMQPLLAIPHSLHTGHWNKGDEDNGSLDEPAFAPFMQLDAAYTYGLSYDRCTAERWRKPALPAFLIETQYEGEHDAQPFEFRRQAYWADLTCGAGQIVGNKTLWPFAAGWRDELESEGTHDMVYLRELLAPLRWYDLNPDQRHTLVTRGYGSWGSTDFVTAASTRDGRLAIAYIPSTGSRARTVTVQMDLFSGPVMVRWYNPTDGTFAAAAGSPFANRGLRDLTTPGDNGTTENDWAVVLEAP
jgi:hypothetical protein